MRNSIQQRKTFDGIYMYAVVDFPNVNSVLCVYEFAFNDAQAIQLFPFHPQDNNLVVR